jgi:hypothetical protein
MLFTANGSGTVRANNSFQNQDDMSVNCETHYKHALGFPVRIVTAASWKDLVFISAHLFILFLIKTILF